MPGSSLYTRRLRSVNKCIENIETTLTWRGLGQEAELLAREEAHRYVNGLAAQEAEREQRRQAEEQLIYSVPVF